MALTCSDGGKRLLPFEEEQNRILPRRTVGICDPMRRKGENDVRSRYRDNIQPLGLSRAWCRAHSAQPQPQLPRQLA
jgi:hypothetical protein